MEVGAESFGGNYCLHLGRIWLVVWHFQLWRQRLKRRRLPLELYL